MARAATGQVVEQRGARGTTYALRFYAYGQRRYITLGCSADGWTRRQADDELAVIMPAVRRGTWTPPAPVAEVQVAHDPTFHEFATQWWESKKGELRDVTQPAYFNELTNHLLPFFHRHRLSQITVVEVDRYKAMKLADRRLAHETINKHLVRLGQILEVAVEYDLIPRNPVKIGKRKLRVTRGRPVHLDSAEHIAALLEVATSLEVNSSGGRRTVGRRALVAALVFAGLRASEAGSLLWRDVDLAAGRLSVGRAKTSASYREVELLPVLRDELSAWKAKVGAGSSRPNDLVFPTREGTRRDKDNIRLRVVAPIATRAAKLLDDAGEQPFPRGVTPHKLRHTFASVLIALGRDPAYVMGQLGHTDPRFTLRVYTHVMSRGDGERDRLRALVDGHDWAETGSSGTDAASDLAVRDLTDTEETAAFAAASRNGSDGT